MSLANDTELEWEKRTKWIMDQSWFQSEASFRLDIPEELDYEEWTDKVIRGIDYRLEKDNQTTGELRNEHC